MSMKLAQYLYHLSFTENWDGQSQSGRKHIKDFIKILILI